MGNQAPETYLSLIASDTIYASLENIDIIIDIVTGDTTYDTTWTYYIGEDPDTTNFVDTLSSAFTTITTSRQELYWWGEDQDGEVIGYWYKWNIDDSLTYTTKELGIFYVPIQTELDVFSFEVAAVDNDSIIDSTPARIVLPIMNSAPTIEFRYRSNPLAVDIPTDTSFTFPTRTFVWDVQDQDGTETITDIFYALDDTCDTCWYQLDAASYSSITLMDIPPGFHTFYVKARDIAGAESETIYFPDPNDPTTADFWKVMQVIGDVLLVDDFDQDSPNNALSYFRNILDTLISVGEGNYSVWEIGKSLPYSATDVTTNLNYFNHVLWYSAYTGDETYEEASSSILSYLMNGGNIFISAAETKDTSFVWFPMDTTFWLNKRYGRLGPNRIIHSQIDSSLDLNIDSEHIIAVRVKGFENFELEPYFRNLYRMPEPVNQFDEWEGTPTVCGIYQFQEPAPSGKAVFMSLPMHDGYDPLLDGSGSVGKFIKYLLEVEFSE